MRLWGREDNEPPSLEAIRKRARILVIDDLDFPPLKLFERDGYHIERWANVKNLSQLTDGDFDLILLDLHGVALRESPTTQGLGILEHVKLRNPSQIVIAYSATSWNPSVQHFFAMADAVLDKDEPYITYKEKVDDLLLRRYSVGFFVGRMNEVLGDQAVLVPRAVPRAIKAIRAGSVGGLQAYLSTRIKDQVTVDRVLSVINIAVTVMRK